MSADRIVIAHLSDLHFGGYAELDQIEGLENFLPTLGLDATVISGDLSQRARHGEFQAAHAFLNRLRPHAPVLVVPGNHDIEWWKSPLDLRGRRRKYRKYSRYFGDLTPVLEIPGAIVRGRAQQLRRLLRLAHLEPPRRGGEGAPAEARDRPGDRDLRRGIAVGRTGAGVPSQRAAGLMSRRMGLARWRSAHRRLLATGADVVLCGHDHHEGAGQVDGTLAVSTSGTHSSRSRGGRPSVFNLVTIDSAAVHIQHFRWEPSAGQFQRSDAFSFARTGPPKVTVSVAGGDQGL